MFSFVVSAIGITLLCIIGIPAIIFYFFHFKKREEKNPVFEFVTLVTLVFSLVSLLSGFTLLSVMHILEAANTHSNSHMHLNTFLPFVYAVSMIGYAYGLMFLALERYLFVIDPKTHEWLLGDVIYWRHVQITMKHRKVMLVVFILVLSVGSSLYNLVMYEVACYNVGEEAQEDIFQLCASDEKAYLTYSDMWKSPLLRISSSVAHLLVHPILPGFFIFWCCSVLLITMSKWLSLHQLFSQIKSYPAWQRFQFTSCLREPVPDEERKLVMRTLVACLLQLVAYAIKAPGYVYMLYSAFLSLHTAHPEWVWLVNKAGHFAALLLPAFAPYILAGPDFAPIITQWLTSKTPPAPSFSNPNYAEEGEQKEEGEEGEEGGASSQKPKEAAVVAPNKLSRAELPLIENI